MDRSDTPTSSSRKKHGAFYTLKKKTRAVTKAPRLLGTRVKHLLRDELYVDVSLRKAPTAVTRSIADLELLAAYHRWLRGVQAFFAIIVFLLSLVSVEESARMVNWTIFGLSIAAVVIILKVYAVKAEYTGLTNVLFENSRNIFTSPFLPQMVLEIVVWLIQTPPVILFWPNFFHLINYFLFLRLYAVVLYIHNAAYVYRSFCRAMTAVVELPLNTAFTLRTALLYRRAKVALLLAPASWLTIACLYSKAEGMPLGDGMWYAFQSISTIGYGDLSPSTLAGRVVTGLAWLVSLWWIAYLVVAGHASLTGDRNEYNMYTLMRCHRLAHAVRHASACVVQTAWRLRRVRRQLAFGVASNGVWLRLQALRHAWRLLRHMETRRAAQRDFAAATRALREANGVSAATGMSAFQQHEQLRHAQRVARHAQRQLDVEAIAQKVLRGRQGGPTRGEIEDAIYGDGHFAPLHPVVDMAGIEKKVEALERLSGRLCALIDALSATAVTNPPSLAQSHT